MNKLYALLFAASFGIAFVSCDDNEASFTDGNKYISSINRTDNNGHQSITLFEYDKIGRIAKIKTNDHDEVSELTVNYSSSKITIVRKSGSAGVADGAGETFVVTLVDGKAQSIVGNGRTTTINYMANRMIESVTETEDVTEQDCKFGWINGNLDFIHNTANGEQAAGYSLSYSDVKLSDMNLDLNYYIYNESGIGDMIMDSDCLNVLATQGYIGQSNLKLMSGYEVIHGVEDMRCSSGSHIMVSCEYTTDSNGYPTTMVMATSEETAEYTISYLN